MNGDIPHPQNSAAETENRKVYFQGPILTMEPGCAPEAVLVENGLISAVGTAEEIREAAGPDAEWVDLKGHCLMPSFIDSHSHFIMNAKVSSFQNLSACTDFADLISTLKAALKDHPAAYAQAMAAYGYDQNFLDERRHPDKSILDQVSTEIPVVILHVSFHIACVNSKALELAGIDSHTEDPEGGRFGRRKGTMEPDGYLEEKALERVLAAVAPLIRINPAAMIRNMQKCYAENGVTTVQDGASENSDLAMLSAIPAGALKLDVVSYPLVSAGGRCALHNYENLLGDYRNHVRIGGYKLVLDGSPQGRSAWMSSPYLHGENGYRGYPRMRDEEVENAIRTAVREGRQILAHCNGDAASEQFITCFEKAAEQFPAGRAAQIRPVMIHCQTVRDDQLARMAKDHMIASIFVGHVWYWGDVHMANFGPQRGNRISPARSAADAGVLVTFHQDTPVTEPNMLHSVWCAVNRRSRSGKVIGKEQAVTVYEALQAVTIHAAYQYFEENSKGSIRSGKRADLVILDRSPMETDPMEINQIRVLETIKDGETIYSAE